VQVLVSRIDGGFLAKIDAHALTHDVLAVKQLADADGGIGGMEGDNDAAEGFEWRP
jgi:hypothetical protein